MWLPCCDRCLPVGKWKSQETRGRIFRILAFLLASFCFYWVTDFKLEEPCLSRCLPPCIRHSADGENNTLQTNSFPETPEPEPEPSKIWNPLLELPVGNGRVPFSLETASDLPTAFASAKSCRKGLNYMFFVHTAPNHWEHRSVIRHSLGNSTVATIYNWTTVFFVGLTTDNATNEKVREEALQHGDMVVLPYLDTYRNLTYKYVYGMKWTLDNCPLVKYNVKLDDDMVINLAMAFNYLKNVSDTAGTALHCTVFDRARPMRYRRSKWYVSRFTYPGKYYPKYCTGGVVFVKNSTVLRSLYNASFSVPFFWIDDVYVTGMAAKIAGVEHVDLKENFLAGKNFKIQLQNLVARKSMLAHIHDVGDRTKAWEYVMSDLKHFKTNVTSYT